MIIIEASLLDRNTRGDPYLLRDEAAEDWYQQLRTAFADSTVRFERDVQIQNGDVVLAGSLTEPLVALRGSALIVPGSGPIWPAWCCSPRWRTTG